MSRHFFHCTDGHSLILDTQGRRARSRRVLECVATMIAARLMQDAPFGIDWTGWIVSVQDRRGSLVEVFPFPAGRA